MRTLKVPTLEPGGLFQDYDLHKVQSLDVPLVENLEMDALSLNYWMTKFVQGVVNPSKERYPQIVCYFVNVVVVLVYKYVH